MLLAALSALIAPAFTGTLVVVNQQADSATLINTATMEVIRHVPVGGGPHEAAVSPDGSRVAVTNYYKQGVGPSKSLSIIKLPSGEVEKTIDLAPYAMPHDIRWVNGSHVVATVEASNALIEVDVDAGKVTRDFKTDRRGSHMLALTTDRSRLYSSNMEGGSVTAFDFKTGKKLAEISCGAETEGVGVTPNGKHIWAGNRRDDTISIIDAESLKVVKTLDSAGFPYRVQFTPDGKYALIPHAMSGELVVADTERMEIVRRLKVGGEGASPAGVWPYRDGKHAFVTVRNHNAVYAVNLETGEELGKVEVQASPDGVAMKPN